MATGWVFSPRKTRCRFSLAAYLAGGALRLPGARRLRRLAALQGKEPARVLEKLQAEYSERIHQLESTADQNGADETAAEAAAHRRLQEEALQIQRQILLDLRNRHVINDEVLRRIQHDLDLAEDRLHHH